MPLADHALPMFCIITAESVIAARHDELYATEGSRVTLGCYTVEKQPIVYCRFLTPRLFGFAVDERQSTPPPFRYMYSGQGLTAGHCGLTVDRVDDTDYGNWTCAVKILDSVGSEEVSTAIVLRKPEGEFGLIRSGKYNDCISANGRLTIVY